MSEPQDSPQPAPRHSTAAGRTPAIDWPRLERITHADPAGRGVAAYRVLGQPLDAGQLQQAASHLANHARRVAIVTGFCRVTATGPAAETDGPPGALLLARALSEAGVEVVLIGDQYSLPLIELGCHRWNLRSVPCIEMPLELPASAATAELSDGEIPSGNKRRFPKSHAWCQQFLTGAGSNLTHLIAVERAGPSHTLSTVAAPHRELFAAEVPPGARGVCHNMRGDNLDPYTARAELLFHTIADRRLPITTIGIGDGGNEIGLGNFPWQVLRAALGTPATSCIACSVATDFALLAGVSDWAAFALALSFSILCGRSPQASAWLPAEVGELVTALVHEAGAVDGVTGQHTATVDGLSLGDYLRPLTELRIALFG